MFLKNISLFLAVFMVLIAYWLHEPIPDEIEDKNQLRAAIVILKFSKLLSVLSEVIGFGSPINLFRSIIERDFIQIPNDGTVEVIDEDFSGVPVRIYRPIQNDKESPKDLPALVYFHGGGFALMTIDTYNSVTYSLAKETGFVVVSVEFRRPPEYKFPIPFDDCLTATVHLLRHGDEFGVDVSKVGVAGDSTGGNLAAAIAQRLAVETGFPSLKFQVLVTPILQAFDFMTPSMITRELPGYLTRRDIINNWLLYYQGHCNDVEKFLINNHTGPLLKASEYGDAVDHGLLPEEFQKQLSERPRKNFGDEKTSEAFEPTLLNPYFSPLLAQNLEKLPPTVIMTADYDIVRDEGFMYVKRLAQAGVRVEHKNFQKSFHGFFCMVGMPIQQEAIAVLRTFLHEILK